MADPAADLAAETGAAEVEEEAVTVASRAAATAAAATNSSLSKEVATKLTPNTTHPKRLQGGLPVLG